MSETTITRRKLLAASAGAVGIAALAGCTAGEPTMSSGREATRPVYTGNLNELSPELRFIVESLDYQNAHIQVEYGDTDDES